MSYLGGMETQRRLLSNFSVPLIHSRALSIVSGLFSKVVPGKELYKEPERQKSAFLGKLIKGHGCNKVSPRKQLIFSNKFLHVRLNFSQLMEF